jgi:hypothetical protein
MGYEGQVCLAPAQPTSAPAAVESTVEHIAEVPQQQA